MFFTISQLFIERYKQWYSNGKLNKERDTAIISLILGSRLLLTKVVTNIDFVKNVARVIRKGNKE